ncbi:MAG TPA: carboxypeptidase regulatory-like domain-containing protein, partial [Thermoplasmata archaeon]|nr:carboxypeptidase regulatory-like domain-containing protein [Thermoplasmata archaeon]
FYGGHLYFTAVSPYTSGGHSFGNYSTHYNLLSTVEWLLGLGGTGNNDGTASFPAMQGLFDFGSTGGSGSGSGSGPDYRLSGTVTVSGTGQPISGATVAVPGGPSTTTNSTGGYLVMLPNGTYELQVTGADLVERDVTVVVSGAPQVVDVNVTPASSTPPKGPAGALNPTGSPLLLIAGVGIAVGAVLFVGVVRLRRMGRGRT